VQYHTTIIQGIMHCFKYLGQRKPNTKQHSRK